MTECLNCKICTKELHHVYIQLVAEQQKTELYRQIIEQKLNLTLTNDSTNIVDLIDAINTRFFNMPTTRKYTLSESETKPNTQSNTKSNTPIPPTKKKIFKSAPRTIELAEDCKSIDFKPIDEAIYAENVDIFGDYDIDVNKDKFNNNMAQLKIAKTTKDCTLILSNLKTQRQLFQLTMSPSDYSTFLIEHIEDIKRSIAANSNIEKKLDSKKIASLLSKILTSLEQRITFQQGFQNQTLNIDEIQKFERCLKLSVKYPKTPRAFNSSNICNFFSNYCLSLFSISKMFEIYISNPYEYYNLIYVNLEGSFAFYTLEKYDGITRYWTLDSRLEELTYKLRDVIRDYCIMLFRKIYKICFNTNDYIENYKLKYNVLEFDCEQLLKNIIFTIDFKNINTSFTELVKNNCVYQPTANDKFSSCADSDEQIRSFKRYKLEETDIVDVIGSVFDNIKDSQCFEIYKSQTQ